MSPAALEELIKRRSADVLHCQERADLATCALMKGSWRDEARRAAADVSRLVAMRSPETVRRMEEERGLR